MNREILFRGKLIDNGKWVEGQYAYLLNFRTEDGEPINHMIVDGTPFGQTVDPTTIGQYTGLTDKNGKRIFDGDILRWTRKDIRLVGYYVYDLHRGYNYGDVLQVISNRAGFMLAGLKDDMLDVPNANAKVDNYKFWNFQGSLEVIGNIHDNPELMEAGEDG